MNVGRYIFAQITDFIPRYVFDKAVKKYKGDFHVRSHLLQPIFTPTFRTTNGLRLIARHLFVLRCS